MKIGVALSGGGIRGIAHAGVLQALEDYHIPINIIGGTSAGSMIASLYAMGYSPYVIYLLCQRNAERIVRENNFSFMKRFFSFQSKGNDRLTGMKDGKMIEEIYDRLAERKQITSISQIKMPLVIPAVDIMKSKEYVFTNYLPKKAVDEKQYITDISIGKAVRASSSFPAVFNPCYVNSHAFMDGGMLDNVPVYEVKKQGADKVLAVKFDADKIDENSNFMDIGMKTIDIMGNKIAEENLEMSDYVLSVYTDKCGLLDVDKLDQCYQYGYESVQKNIKQIKQIFLNDI
ncbi:MAG: patatin-like phospholipase family protein [Clostridia bacterium]|nr:patatin-like phospholipase family protein [Clostridia bacterium]